MGLKETASQMANHANPEVRQLAFNLPTKGGWRTLFDPFSSEWYDTTLDEKLRMLNLLERNGYMIIRLSREFRFYYAKTGRTDIANAVDVALATLLGYAVNDPVETP